MLKQRFDEIVFLDLPEEGNSLTINNSCGDVESIKTTPNLSHPLNSKSKHRIRG